MVLRNDTSSSLVGWTSQPDRRGTIDILFTCGTALVLCLFSMLHLNVPAPSESWWRHTWRKLKYMVISVVWPEFPAVLAVGQWAAARRSWKLMKTLPRSEEWTMIHACYAEMGGFMMKTPDLPPFAITSKQLHWIIDAGYAEVPNITTDEIWDRSKADMVLKILACAQVGWLVLQVAARACQELPISLLEIATCDVIAAWMPTVYFWFRKPLDVSVPEVIEVKTPMSVILVNAGDMAKKPFRQSPLDFVEGCDQFSNLFTDFLPIAIRQVLRPSPRRRPMERLPNDRDPWFHSVPIMVLVALPFYLLSGLNFAAWNTSFPTAVERLLWRICCIVYAACMMFWGHLEMIIQAWEGSTETILGQGRRYKFKFPWALAFWVPVLSVFAARICMIGEILASLRAMPPDVYKNVEWTNFIPHV